MHANNYGNLMTDPLHTISQTAYALAYQLVGKREDAMYIIQDAATVALSHETAPSRHSSDFKPWFFKVVRNRAFDQLRRQQRLIHQSIEEDHIGESVDDPQAYMEQLQLKDTIHKALMCLSMEQREIVLLKDYHGFSYAQIANILEIPSGSVMSRLHRARLALRKKLGEINQSEVFTNDTL